MKVGDVLREGTHEIIAFEGLWGVVKNTTNGHEYYYLFHVYAGGHDGIWTTGPDDISDPMYHNNIDEPPSKYLINLCKLLQL